MLTVVVLLLSQEKINVGIFYPFFIARHKYTWNIHIQIKYTTTLTQQRSRKSNREARKTVAKLSVFFLYVYGSWLAAWCCGFLLLLCLIFCPTWFFLVRFLWALIWLHFVCGIYICIFCCLRWHFRWQPLRQLFFRPEIAYNVSIFCLIL